MQHTREHRTSKHCKAKHNAKQFKPPGATQCNTQLRTEHNEPNATQTQRAQRNAIEGNTTQRTTKQTKATDSKARQLQPQQSNAKRRRA